MDGARQVEEEEQEEREGTKEEEMGRRLVGLDDDDSRL